MPRPAHFPLNTPALRTGALVATALALAVTGCTKDSAPAADSISLNASDTRCDLGRTDFNVGVNTLNITNSGSKVTEVYVYTSDQKIVTERENITPGATAELTFELKPGSYEIACKPGGTGAGIRTKISVGGAASSVSGGELDTAVTQYRAYVQEQADAGLPQVKEFAAAIKANDLTKAQRLYAPSRQNWERVEPVAESFGDLDPKLDLREADLEPGQTWTGWHRLEKAIFKTKSTSGQAKYADQLVTDYQSFQQKVATAEITATSMANGAKELLDEVATGKITGEENIWSGKDLWDFAANVEGAEKVFSLLSPTLAKKDSALNTELSAAFADVKSGLAPYRRSNDFVDYRKVTEPQRKKLADQVNSLAEPLSKLAAAVIK